LRLERLALRSAAAGIGATALCATAVLIQDSPGEDVMVRPAASTIAEENFRVPDRAECPGCCSDLVPGGVAPIGGFIAA